MVQGCRRKNLGRLNVMIADFLFKIFFEEVMGWFKGGIRGKGV